MAASEPRRIHHIDVVVRDLESATERFRRILGIEPRGRETLASRGIDLARFRVGETWLILVQPTRDDSPVATYLRQHGEGFFHMAIEFEDVEAKARALEQSGIRLVQPYPRAGVDGWKLVDIDLGETFGAMIQLVESPED